MVRALTRSQHTIGSLCRMSLLSQFFYNVWHYFPLQEVDFNRTTERDSTEQASTCTKNVHTQNRTHAKVRNN